ncbi:MAG: hypothetical protein LBD02_04455 [Christensenellaceae bacterium]|jgi:RsiW-degrading membrane proteinase PrsW (M82 family)|nr:hypothetical protein [Christensenellaceae bacterium]
MVVVTAIVVLCFAGVGACFLLAAAGREPLEELGKTLALGGPLAVVAWIIGVGFDHHTANLHGLDFSEEDPPPEDEAPTP